MYTTKCSGCGLEIPVVGKHRTCKWCNTPLEKGICRDCGELAKLDIHTSRCRNCHQAYKFLPHLKAKEEAQRAFDNWIADINSLPQPYENLTQKQWLAACAYFNKCALCSETEIDTRGFFIPFKYGGKYCNWNIIPVCESCSRIWRMHWNPWYRVDTTYLAGKWDRKYLNKVVVYLQERMDELRCQSKDEMSLQDLSTT